MVLGGISKFAFSHWLEKEPLPSSAVMRNNNGLTWPHRSSSHKILECASWKNGHTKRKPSVIKEQGTAPDYSSGERCFLKVLGLMVLQLLTQPAENEFQLSITVTKKYFLISSLNHLLNNFWSCPLLPPSSMIKSRLRSYSPFIILKVSIESLLTLRLSKRIKGRLHNHSLNLGSTELVQLQKRVQFWVQRIWIAPRIYERVLLNCSLTRNLYTPCPKKRPTLSFSVTLTRLH